MKLTPEERFWAKVSKGSENACWAWLSATNYKGYGQFRANGTTVQAHRFAWSLINGEIPSGMLICHHCDNPPCVRPDHLFLGTPHDNNVDCWTKGRGRTGGFGHSNPRAKLNKERVEEILRLSAKGVVPRIIADMFGVHGSTIAAVLSGRSWRYIKGERIRRRSSKLSSDDVREIRRLYSEGVIGKKLADRFGISSSNLYAVLLFQTHKGVT